MEKKLCPVRFGHFLLEFVSGHFSLAAPINQHCVFCAETLDLGHGVDGGVSTSNDRDAIPDRDLMQRVFVNTFYKIQRLNNFWQIFAGNVHARSSAKPDCDEDSVKTLLDLGDWNIVA